MTRCPQSATVAFIALRIAARSPDAGHNFGHLKVEYISAIVEGVMIAAAATVIVASAVDRLMHPRELEHIGIGLGISVLASLINATAAMTLLRVGRRHRSLALEADGKHLMTDVWTPAPIRPGGWRAPASRVARRRSAGRRGSAPDTPAGRPAGRSPVR